MLIASKICLAIMCVIFFLEKTSELKPTHTTHRGPTKWRLVLKSLIGDGIHYYISI